jgi:Mg2+ and Co2+ transporter CorA
LHPLAVEDPIKAPLRTKLERYEGTLFLVLKAARYIDESETVEFDEVHTFMGENFVVISNPSADGCLPMPLPKITPNLDISTIVQQSE